jgi:hypothetical protein
MEKRGAARRGRTILSLPAGFTNTNAPERPTSRRLSAVVASWNWLYSACSVPRRALKLDLLGRGSAYWGGALQGCADLNSAVSALKLRRLAVAGTGNIEFRLVAASNRIHPGFLFHPLRLGWVWRFVSLPFKIYADPTIHCYLLAIK